jgi:hypothetical protein
MTNELPPSFSRGRKWSLSLNTTVSLVAALALVLMVNYLGARHFTRWSVATDAQAELSPFSRRVLAGVTNTIKVTLYFNKKEPLYQMSLNLLKAYRFANDRIQVEAVDYLREPGAAELAKVRYKLSDQNARDVIIFDCQGRPDFVYQGELSDLDVQEIMQGKSSEAKRTHFKGEALFTAAIMNVISTRQPKAYFLEGHGEQNPESDDGGIGYSRFAGVLHENNIAFDKLRLEGPTEVPPDCNLLIIAGGQKLPPEVLEKVERYLKQGGRLFALFQAYSSVLRPTGLEKLLSAWGVAVGRNLVTDEKHAISSRGNDMVVSTFGTHPIVQPIYGSGLYLLLPRSISLDRVTSRGADAPKVEAIAFTSAGGRALTDIRPEGVQPSPTDLITNIPLVVAVEKGGIRNLTVDKGATRIVVAGDSRFLANDNIDREANHEFASHVVNWLLARNDLLVPIPPKRIPDFKLTLTASQVESARWILIGGFPGTALLLGGLVWLRRRR